MPRGSELIGLTVLSEQNLTPIGQVREVLLSADGSRICGLVLEGGRWRQPRRTLDYAAVRSVGETSLIAAEVYLTQGTQTRCGRDLQGLPILRRTGEEVGVVDDFHFDPATGRLTALQVSRGFVDDLLSGKELVPLDGPVTAGQAAILLDGPGETGGALP